jgi:hypothetical protein
LADLGECYLENSGVGKISVTGDGAGDTPSEISLAIESLLNGFHGKVGVTPVGHLPVSNLGVTSKVNILCAVSNQLHQTSSHVILLLKKKISGIFF